MDTLDYSSSEEDQQIDVNNAEEYPHKNDDYGSAHNSNINSKQYTHTTPPSMECNPSTHVSTNIYNAEEYEYSEEEEEDEKEGKQADETAQYQMTPVQPPPDAQTQSIRERHTTPPPNHTAKSEKQTVYGKYEYSEEEDDDAGNCEQQHRYSTQRSQSTLHHNMNNLNINNSQMELKMSDDHDKYPILFQMRFKQNPWNPWDTRNHNDQRAYSIVNKPGGPGTAQNKAIINSNDQSGRHRNNNNNSRNRGRGNRHLCNSSEFQQNVPQDRRHGGRSHREHNVCYNNNNNNYNVNCRARY